MTLTPIFPVPQQEFAGGPEFREYLASNKASRSFRRPLTILVGLSKRRAEDIPSALGEFGLRVAGRMGKVLKVRSDGPVKLEAYLTLEDDGVLVFYTDYRKTEDVPLLTEFLAKDRQSRPLRIRSSVIRKTLDYLLGCDPELRVTRFTARGSPETAKKNQVRPERTRTFAYWGNDGREVLSELSRQYGVSLTSLVVDLPGRAKIGIDDRGMLTHQRGDTSLVFDSLGKALEEARRNVLAIDKARFEVYPLRNRGVVFQIPKGEPTVIRLRSRFSFTNAEKFFGDVLPGKECSRLSLLTQEGSLFVSADIAMAEGGRFRVRADEDEIRLLPFGPVDFRSFLSFYELVLDHVDPDAELVG